MSCEESYLTRLFIWLSVSSFNWAKNYHDFMKISFLPLSEDFKRSSKGHKNICDQIPLIYEDLENKIKST